MVRELAQDKLQALSRQAVIPLLRSLAHKHSCVPASSFSHNYQELVKVVNVDTIRQVEVSKANRTRNKHIGGIDNSLVYCTKEVPKACLQLRGSVPTFRQKNYNSGPRIGREYPLPSLIKCSTTVRSWTLKVHTFVENYF